MQGEPDKPSAYWTYPKTHTTFTATAAGHPNAPLLHITSYEFLSSAVHPRHNDHEPTGILQSAMTRQAASQMVALTITALQIAERQDTLHDLTTLLLPWFPELFTREPEPSDI